MKSALCDYDLNFDSFPTIAVLSSMLSQKIKNNTSTFESQLWAAADTLRGLMDAAEYKYVVLGLIFLKYSSDAFEERHARPVAGQAQGADPKDLHEYRAHNIFRVPTTALRLT